MSRRPLRGSWPFLRTVSPQNQCVPTPRQFPGKREERGYCQEQINNEGVAHLGGKSVTVSSGIYRDKGIAKANLPRGGGALPTFG